MKIALPLIDEHELALDFSKSKSVGIYDDETDILDIISIMDNSKESDLGILFRTLIQYNLKYIVSPFCSFLTLKVFRDNNLEALQAIGTNLNQNIELLKKNELKPFISSEIYSSKKCGSSCSSCEISCVN